MSVYGEMAVGAGLNAGLGVINNIIAAKREQKAREENFKYNEMAAENAQKRTEAFYNQYQSPEALLRQYKDAGLSPSLMFGGSGAGGGATPADGAQGNGISGVNPTTYGIEAMQGAQVAALNAQARKLNAEADTEEGKNTRGIAEIDNLFKDASRKLAETENVKANTALTEIQTNIAKLEKELKQETFWTNVATSEAILKETIENANKLAAEGKIASIQAEYDEETYETKIKTAQADLRLIKEKIASEEQGRLFTVKQMKEIDQRIDKMVYDMQMEYFYAQLHKGEFDWKKLCDRWEQKNKKWMNELKLNELQIEKVRTGIQAAKVITIGSAAAARVNSMKK